MKVRELLARTLRTMGKAPSSTSPSRNFSGSGFTADLTIDEDQLNRIEARVFQRLGGDSGSLIDEISDSRTRGISESDLIELVYGPSEEAIDISGEEPARGEWFSPRRKRVLIVCGVLLILLAVSAALPLRWTGGRLTLAFGELAQANALTSTAADRLEFIVRVGTVNQEVLIAGVEMTSSASAALDILNRVPASPARDEAAGRLFGIMSSAGHHLRKIERSAGETDKPQIRAIITASDMIALQARWLLSFGEKAISWPDQPADSSPSRSAFRRPPRAADNQRPTAATTTETPLNDQTQNGGNPPPPENDCDINQGSICITVPPLPSL